MLQREDEKVREIRDPFRMAAEQSTEASSVSRQVFVPSNILTNTFVFDTVSFLSILTLMVFIGRFGYQSSESWTLFTARLIELDSAQFNQAWKAGSFFPLFGPIISGFLEENNSQIDIIIVFIYDHLVSINGKISKYWASYSISSQL